MKPLVFLFLALTGLMGLVFSIVIYLASGYYLAISGEIVAGLVLFFVATLLNNTGKMSLDLAAWLEKKL